MYLYCFNSMGHWWHRLFTQISYDSQTTACGRSHRLFWKNVAAISDNLISEVVCWLKPNFVLRLSLSFKKIWKQFDNMLCCIAIKEKILFLQKCFIFQIQFIYKKLKFATALDRFLQPYSKKKDQLCTTFYGIMHISLLYMYIFIVSLIWPICILTH